MGLKIIRPAKAALLAALQSTLNGYTLHLYQNNHTPSDADVATPATNYTECNFAGYASQALTSWGTAFLNASNQGEIDETVRTFTRSSTGSPQSIYGYYVTDGSGNLAWAELNPSGPGTVTASGDTYQVFPRLVDDDL